MAEELTCPVCPVWVGHLLANPLRKLFQNPVKILSPYIEPGMTVLDAGCAMGFFSLPAAQMVGAQGRVICADFQKGMLDALGRRVRRTRLKGQIITHLCRQDSLELDAYSGDADIALAMMVVHETPDARKFFSELFEALKPQGRVLFAEPHGHVSEEDFEVSLAAAESAGFQRISRPEASKMRMALLGKQRD